MGRHTGSVGADTGRHSDWTRASWHTKLLAIGFTREKSAACVLIRCAAAEDICNGRGRSAAVEGAGEQGCGAVGDPTGRASLGDGVGVHGEAGCEETATAAPDRVGGGVR